MAVTKKSVVSKNSTKKPAKKSNSKIEKPTSAEKLATATTLARF